MNRTFSLAGAVAAVIILGIGLLAVGKLAVGVAVLIGGGLAMGIMLSSSGARKAVLVGLGAVLLGGALGCQAARNEFSGTATYRAGMGHGIRPEAVTREGAPAKFRTATNLLWGGSIFSLLVGVGAFNLARKLND